MHTASPGASKRATSSTLSPPRPQLSTIPAAYTDQFAYDSAEAHAQAVSQAGRPPARLFCWVMSNPDFLGAAGERSAQPRPKRPSDSMHPRSPPRDHGRRAGPGGAGDVGPGMR